MWAEDFTTFAQPCFNNAVVFNFYSELSILISHVFPYSFSGPCFMFNSFGLTGFFSGYYCSGCCIVWH